MNTNMDTKARGDSGPRTIITIELPAEAAARMLEPSFLETINEQFAKAGLPRVESIKPVNPPDSANGAS